MHDIYGTHSSKPEGARWPVPESLSANIYDATFGDPVFDGD
jgi:hypothetical protein